MLPHAVADPFRKPSTVHVTVASSDRDGNRVSEDTIWFSTVATSLQIAKSIARSTC